MAQVRNPLLPVWDEYCHILILGSMPSPASRAAGFYYMHPQNRFWPVLAAVYGEPVPCTRLDRAAFAIEHGIALWDVLLQCEIRGASDASIAEPTVNPVAELLRDSGIQRVFTAGTAAARLYRRYLLPETGTETVSLPSPSAANARMDMDALVRAYSVLLEVERPDWCR